MRRGYSVLCTVPFLYRLLCNIFMSQGILYDNKLYSKIGGVSMYRKAGIIVAIILIVLAILVSGVLSCEGRGIMLSKTAQDGSKAESSIVYSQEKSGEFGASRGNSGHVPVNSQTGESSGSGGIDSEVTHIEGSTVSSDSSEVSNSNSSINSSADNNSSSHTSSNVSTDSSTDSSDDISFGMTEIDEVTVKYEYKDKEMNGVLFAKKTYYSDGALFMAFEINTPLGTLTYFVPQDAYDTLNEGDIVKLVVRCYEKGGNVILTKVLKVTA